MTLSGLKHGGRDGEQRGGAQHSDLEPSGKLNARGGPAYDAELRVYDLSCHPPILTQTDTLVHGTEPCLP